MKRVEGAIRLAATDIANHVACRHLTALDLALADGLVARPEHTAWLAAALQRRGDEHERAYVLFLRSQLTRILDLREAPLDAGGLAATRAAMRSGIDAILQAPLGTGPWIGRADVLRRVDRPSRLGGWSYEPYDTKLAKETRGSAILQLANYTESLEALQGTRPEHIHVVTPGRPFVERPFRIDDFFAYYSFVRRRLLAFVEGGDVTTPEPVAHCEICRWQAECRRRLRQDDHLSFVAGIRSLHIAELREWQVTTLAGFGAMPVPLPRRPRRVSADSLTRAQSQARLQLAARTSGQRLHELLPLIPGEGLHRLPAPSAGDIFFDLEGDPFAGESGREFLFGYAFQDADGAWQYVGQWALDAAQERRAFESFVAFVAERRSRHPDLHVFHYAAYEPAALRRLMGKHAACEDEVDLLLRGRVLVDLYAVVRQSLRASVERYSIKDLEPFYQFERRVPLPEVGPHMKAVQWQLEFDDASLTTHETWPIVEGYNRDDCVSAAALRDWLESLRAGLEASGTPLPRPAAVSTEPPEELKERELAVRALMSRLLAGVPDEVSARSDEQQARWLLAQLLEFHRREDKAVWWEFFRLAEMAAEDALEEPSAIGGLEFVERVGGTKRCPIDRYRFPAQELTRPRGAVRHGTELVVGKVERFDWEARTIDVKKTQKAADLHPTVVFFHDRFDPEALQEALRSYGAAVADGGLDNLTECRALNALLLNRPPALRAGEAWEVEGEPMLERATRLAVALDGAVLPVQGPPGAGKTYTGAHMAVALARAGFKVGVTATSHQVIRHLLDTIVEVSSSTACVSPESSGFSRRSESLVDSGFSQRDERPAGSDRGRGDRAAGSDYSRTSEQPADSGFIRSDERPASSDFCRNGDRPTGSDFSRSGEPCVGSGFSRRDSAPVLCIQKVSDGKEAADADGGPIRTTASNAEVLAALANGEANIAAGTAWLWARPEFRLAVDVLIVDEAGQMSLGNVLAAGQAARNLILLGDPQQLEQPLKGSHPLGTDVSALQHVLGTRKTIPPERGLFLAETWRLAPAVCAFTSELFYEGRLLPRAGLERQRIDGPFGLVGTGFWLLPVAHAGNQSCSLEEADVVGRLVGELTRGAHTWTDDAGAVRPIAAKDVIIVAPYNAQVAAIQERAPGVLVGTVDRFQGREAAIVIYSMATSSPEDAPRGMEFLYSLNRLNVATSRARCAVVLVANPRLFEVDCQTPQQMRLANAYCRYLELARELRVNG